ncbi:MAG: JAB domain-containing protein [Solirubrobacteraceae bacterium]
MARIKENPSPAKPLHGSGTKQFGAHNVHNHPSAVKEPSHADEAITRRIVS